jgi:hypothetical protein
MGALKEEEEEIKGIRKQQRNDRRESWKGKQNRMGDKD